MVVIGVAIPFLAGITLVYLSITANLAAKSSRTWRPIPAQIVEFSRHSPARGGQYQLLRYKFILDGKPYESDRIAFGVGSKQLATCDGTYSVGDGVTAYVNPKHPEVSVLRQGVAKGTTECLTIGLLLLGCGVFGIWAAANGKIGGR